MPPIAGDRVQHERDDAAEYQLVDIAIKTLGKQSALDVEEIVQGTLERGSFSCKDVVVRRSLLPINVSPVQGDQALGRSGGGLLLLPLARAGNLFLEAAGYDTHGERKYRDGKHGRERPELTLGVWTRTGAFRADRV